MKDNLPIILKFLAGAGIVTMHFILILCKIPIPADFIIIETAVLTWLGVIGHVTNPQSPKDTSQ